jgi:hypothetical protein
MSCSGVVFRLTPRPHARIVTLFVSSEVTMPIRTATLKHQLELNGARLHAAMLARAASHGADDPPSEKEQALLAERRALHEAQEKRRAQALLPKPKAVKETRPAKLPKAAKPGKAPKEHKDAKDAKDVRHAKDGKGAKPHLSRTELHAKKAEALAAAKQAARQATAKKPAKH